MNNKLALAASAVLCVATARPAAANEVGFYVGGYFGQFAKDAPRAEYEALDDGLQEIFFFTPVDERSSFDERDTGFGIFVGYRLTRYIAFEGGYMNLGQVTHRSRSTGDFSLDSGTLNVNIESETTGFTASVLGTLPLTRDWELFARGGALFANNDLKISITARGEMFSNPNGSAVSDSFAKGTTDMYASLGITRRVLEIYELRLEYQRVFNAGLEITGGKGDLDGALLGLTVTF